MLYGFARGLLLSLSKVLFRIRISGTEHVPTSGVFIVAPTHDELADVAAVKAAADAAAPVYALRRVGSALKTAYPDGGRDFAAASREEAYAWLGQRLVARAGNMRNVAN